MDHSNAKMTLDTTKIEALVEAANALAWANTYACGLTEGGQRRNRGKLAKAWKALVAAVEAVEEEGASLSKHLRPHPPISEEHRRKLLETLAKARDARSRSSRRASNPFFAG